MVLGGLTGGVNVARADTFVVDAWTHRQYFNASFSTTFTVSLDKSIYSPGEIITASGSYLIATCVNHAGEESIVTLESVINSTTKSVLPSNTFTAENVSGFYNAIFNAAVVDELPVLYTGNGSYIIPYTVVNSCTATSWSPDPSGTCSNTTLTQTSNCGNTRTVYGTTCCDTTWTPDPLLTCSPLNVNQTSNCGRTRTVTGTKVSTTWTPDPSGYCTTETFVQTGNCGGTRTVWGTRCCDTTWAPNPALTCSTAMVTQTSNCGRTRTIPGTKPSTTWTPSPTLTCASNTFTQTGSPCGETRVINGTKNCVACGYKKGVPSLVKPRATGKSLCSDSSAPVIMLNTVPTPDRWEWTCGADTLCTAPKSTFSFWEF